MTPTIALPSPSRAGRERRARLRNFNRHLSLAWFFAWSDARARYKRSVLGPFWLVLSTMIGIGGLGLVWGALMQVDRSVFIPLLTVGLVMWNLISGSVTGSTNVFARHASVIKNIPTPTLRISLQLLFEQIVNFLHNLVVVALMLMVYPEHLSPMALLALPGLALVLANLLWVIQVLGILGARFRDFDPLVSALMPILFFMSPVLYQSHQLGTRAFVMRFNPMSYWVEIVREPILGTVPSAFTYGITIVMAIAGWALAVWLTRAKAVRIPYWV